MIGVMDTALTVVINTGIAVCMYIVRRTVTDFSSNGAQQLKGYFSNNNDSYILAAFGFFLCLCSTPTMFSKKCKRNMSYKSQNIKTIPNMIPNNDVNLYFFCVSLKFYQFVLIFYFASIYLSCRLTYVLLASL